jgi:hypothetical protein
MAAGLLHLLHVLYDGLRDDPRFIALLARLK